MMSKIIYIFFLTIPFLFNSCRFSKPLFSNAVRIDSSSVGSNLYDTLKISTTYNYFRISRHGFIGKYVKEVQYDKDSNLLAVSHNRISTNKNIRGGYVKYKQKRMQYKNGIISKRSYQIYRHKGRVGKLKFSKTILYDINGKVIKKENNKKDVANK